MHNKGSSHRHIHEAIKEKGFEGSRATVYQYLIKYSRENNLLYGNNSRVINSNCEHEHILDRPPHIALERVSKHSIYQSLLHEAAIEKDKWRKESSPKLIENNDEDNIRISPEWNHCDNPFFIDTGFTESLQSK